jgi:hypothetical protein
MKSAFVGWSVRGVVSLALSVSAAACATSDAEIGFPAGGHSGDGMDVAGSLADPAAGSGGDGLGGGMNAGQAAPAGAGGAAGQAGAAGSLAGAGAGGAGTGGAGAGGMAAAGSGGAGGCPTQYTMATHVVMSVTWSGSLAITKGSGQVHVWTKSKFNESGSSATIESMSCGSTLPEIQTTAIAGNKKVLPEIPNAAWDSADMPKFAGTATKSSSTQTIESGIALVGLTLPTPTVAWPSATSITGADHDGDKMPGITAVAKDGGGYSPPPTSLAQTHVADKLYLATRNVMTMTASVPGCPETITGTANVTKFENHVIGCHVKGGGECTSSEASFVDDNRTVYKVGSATFTSKLVPDTATCADVRAAIP